MGYVTWSSTSVGLRPSQFAVMMTWTSERSGIASIGVFLIAHTPPPTIARISRRTTKALRALKEMSFSITQASLLSARLLLRRDGRLRRRHRHAWHVRLLAPHVH